MPRFTHIVAGVAAMLALPAAAVAAPAANPASSLSVAGSTRAASDTARASRIGAEVPTTTLISIGILAALTGIVLLVADGDDDNSDSN
ncbi:hypothetical protein [Sphingomonas sp. BK235]|uniref:hypothetical protein n=1 Tax=Sphingomonas sp. BK235 TaxID=2512131 RepID=UPI001049548E|nr:hypothetical protein [Sphingomonas sp. BK235]TCP34272.1 hypothetical protein EV292_104263 [Sphingomonas sp. BK235]